MILPPLVLLSWLPSFVATIPSVPKVWFPLIANAAVISSFHFSPEFSKAFSAHLTSVSPIAKTEFCPTAIWPSILFPSNFTIPWEAFPIVFASSFFQTGSRNIFPPFNFKVSTTSFPADSLFPTFIIEFSPPVRVLIAASPATLNVPLFSISFAFKAASLLTATVPDSLFSIVPVTVWFPAFTSNFPEPPFSVPTVTLALNVWLAPLLKVLPKTNVPLFTSTFISFVGAFPSTVTSSPSPEPPSVTLAFSLLRVIELFELPFPRFKLEALKPLFTTFPSLFPSFSPITRFSLSTFTVTLSKTALSPNPAAWSISILPCISPSVFTKVPSIKIEVLLSLFSFIAAIAEVK